MKKLELAKAYRRCEEITKHASSTFYIGSRLLPKEMRRHVWAIYAYCRVVDDVVDEDEGGVEEKLGRLELLRQVVKYASGRENIAILPSSEAIIGQVNSAIFDTFKKYPDLTLQPFLDLVDGVSTDLPIGAKNISLMRTWDELIAYCEKVAGGVGEMICRLCGVTNEKTIKAARQMGDAMQLTNIIRDFGEDLHKGRIYIPLEHLKLNTYQIHTGDVNDLKIRDVMRTIIAEVKNMYRESRVELKEFPLRVRFALTVASLLYEGILDDAEQHGYDVLSRRSYVTTEKKLWCLLRAGALLILK